MQYSYESFLVELGAKLKQMRRDRGWSLRYMVLQHRFHVTHWQSFEKGKGISMPSLLRVCEVFGVRLEDLVAGLGIMEAADPKGDEAPALSGAVATKSVAKGIAKPVKARSNRT